MSSGQRGSCPGATRPGGFCYQKPVRVYISRFCSPQAFDFPGWSFQSWGPSHLHLAVVTSFVRLGHWGLRMGQSTGSCGSTPPLLVSARPFSSTQTQVQPRFLLHDCTVPGRELRRPKQRFFSFPDALGARCGTHNRK